MKWRKMSFLPAPTAARTAISLCLDSARTSTRFATLAHAINRTKPTRAQQDPKGLGEVADDGLFERVHQDTELPRSDEGEICVRALVAFHEAIDQGRQKGLGHVGGSPGSEPGNRIEAEASRVGVVGIHGKREPQSRLVQDIEFAGKHPDDFPGCSI